MAPNAPPAVPSDAPPAAPLMWWLGIRPKTLLVAIAPVLVGTALAAAETGAFAVGPMAAALLGALLIQAGTNLHNDAADFERGADGPGRAGPERITAQGWARPGQVRAAAYVAFAGAAAVGLYLVWVGGWPILALGLASICAGLAYTGGPRPIAYQPLGEIFVFAFFGLGAGLGSYWLQAGALSAAALLGAAAVGAPATAVLVVNNHRDRTGDARVGKRTLAVVLGPAATEALYAALMLAPFALAVPLLSLGRYAWLPFLLGPWALVLCYRFFATRPGPAFNPLLADTARFELAFGVLLALGVVLR